MARTVSPRGARRRRVQMTPAAWQQAAECLRILAHPQRLQMLRWLLDGQPIRVGELANRCELSQPQTSDHLRLMQHCGFLTSRREGREVFYEVVESHLQQILDCIENRFGK